MTQTCLLVGFIRFSPLKLTTAVVPPGNPYLFRSFYTQHQCDKW